MYTSCQNLQKALLVVSFFNTILVNTTLLIAIECINNEHKSLMQYIE